MNEEWRDVVGYEGAYQVSDLGRVRSLDRTVIRSNGRPLAICGRLLKAGPGHAGYRRVTIAASCEKPVHLMVLEAFHGPRPGPGFQGAHQDGVKENCHRGNLSWKTIGDNCKDKIRHGTNKPGEENPNSKLAEEQVRDLRLRVAAGEKRKDIAGEFGVTRTCICQAYRRVTWRHV